jgi:hypothetical protein
MILNGLVGGFAESAPESELWVKVWGNCGAGCIGLPGDSLDLNAKPDVWVPPGTGGMGGTGGTQGGMLGVLMGTGMGMGVDGMSSWMPGNLGMSGGLGVRWGF